MIRNSLRWLVVFSVLVTMWSVGGLAPKATAASTNTAAAKCAIIKANTVGGINFARLKVVRSCDQITFNAVGGKALVSKNRIQVRYHGKLSPSTQVAKTTLHELTHMVEYKTTPQMRVKLYSYLGVKTMVPTAPSRPCPARTWPSGSSRPVSVWPSRPSPAASEAILSPA